MNKTIYPHETCDYHIMTSRTEGDETQIITNNNSDQNSFIFQNH